MSIASRIEYWLSDRSRVIKTSESVDFDTTLSRLGCKARVTDEDVPQYGRSIATAVRARIENAHAAGCEHRLHSWSY